MRGNGRQRVTGGGTVLLGASGALIIPCGGMSASQLSSELIQQHGLGHITTAVSGQKRILTAYSQTFENNDGIRGVCQYTLGHHGYRKTFRR